MPKNVTESRPAFEGGIDVVRQPFESTLRALAAYIAVAAFAAAYLLPFMRVLRRVGDEGSILYGAHRILNGQIAGRDFFEPIGPLPFYWLAAFFRIFGEAVYTSRGLLLGTGVLLSLLVFYFARTIKANRAICVLFAVTLLIPVFPANSQHWDSDLFALSAFAAFLKWQQNRKDWLLVSCGLFAGLTTCAMQHKGFLMCLALVISLLLAERRNRLRCMGAVIAGYLAVLLALAAFYASEGALGALVYSNLIWPALHYRAVNSVPYGFGLLSFFVMPWFNSLRTIMPLPGATIVTATLAAPLIVLFALPVLLAACAALLRKRAFSTELLPFWIGGVALWASELHRPDMCHLVYGSPILIVLVVSLCERIRCARIISTLTVICLVLASALSLLAPLSANTKIQTRRGVLYGFKHDIGWNTLFAHTPAREPILVYPYDPMYYFISATENPTQLSILMYGYNTPAEFKSATECLEARHVQHVLWDTQVSGSNLVNWFPHYHQPTGDEAIMERYIESHYHQIAFANGFRVMARND